MNILLFKIFSKIKINLSYEKVIFPREFFEKKVKIMVCIMWI